MAGETVKSAAVTNFDASPQVQAMANQQGSPERIIKGTHAFSAVGELEATDIFRFARVPANALIHEIIIYKDDLATTALTADVGLYAKNDGAVKDVDAYASAYDLNGADTAGTNVAFEARNINLMLNQVYQDAGDSDASAGEYDLALTFVTSTAPLAADISWVVKYTTNS